MNIYTSFFYLSFKMYHLGSGHCTTIIIIGSGAGEQSSITQSAGAVEYINCTSAEG